MVNGHSSPAASTVHVLTAGGQQRSRTGAEHHFQPQKQQHQHSVDSARASTVTASPCSSVSHDDRSTTDTQVLTNVLSCTMH